MKCPRCTKKASVKQSVFIDKNNSRVRRYWCANCGYLFYTYEVVVEYADVRRDFMDVQNVYKKQRRDEKKLGG